MNKHIKILSFTLALLLSVFLSLYSITQDSWLWESGLLHQKILGTTSGLAAFTGVIATIYFWKRKPRAFLLGILNAFLFGSYALSINLTGDFIVNLFWYVPIMFFMSFYLKKSNEIKEKVFNKKSGILLAISFILVFIGFFFITPLMNEGWSDILGEESVKYGKNFNYYWVSRVLDTLMNSVSSIAVVMMILGYKYTWIVWLFKNISGIIFFGGIGVLNISILLMNIIFLIISIFIYYNIYVNKESEIKIAIIGPGAVGKTTVISHIQDFLDENKIIPVQEREDFIDEKFADYMSNMKNSAFATQKNFFQKRYKQIQGLKSKPRAMIDRHIIDDFIFPRVHIECGNFTKDEAKEWVEIEKEYWDKLGKEDKLDIVFILQADNETIESRRAGRSAIDEKREDETKNTNFFRLVNEQYHNSDSIMFKAVNEFSNKHYKFINKNSKETAKSIEKIIKEFLSQ
ncbi:MAG: nicotinamide mononucleotide transporter [Mycoplasmataceae bacterium]|nr:nicotinamide mononucleotide transporter [Mycoplasmataceae bacterium]